jgi:hypothetical protein
MFILNWAFGCWEMIPCTRSLKETGKGLELTVMLARGEGRAWEKEFSNQFDGQHMHVQYYPA